MHMFVLDSAIHEKICVTISKLNTMRNKLLSMKPGLIFLKFLQVPILHDMAISELLHKKTNPSFLRKDVKSRAKKGEFAES